MNGVLFSACQVFHTINDPRPQLFGFNVAIGLSTVAIGLAGQAFEQGLDVQVRATDDLAVGDTVVTAGLSLAGGGGAAGFGTPGTTEQSVPSSPPRAVTIAWAATMP